MKIVFDDGAEVEVFNCDALSMACATSCRGRMEMEDGFYHTALSCFETAKIMYVGLKKDRLVEIANREIKRAKDKIAEVNERDAERAAENA